MYGIRFRAARGVNDTGSENGNVGMEHEKCFLKQADVGGLLCN